MAETPKHAAGTFCWVELASSDQGAARSFYSALFGWEAEEVQMSEDSTYTMFHNGGRYTAARRHVRGHHARRAVASSPTPGRGPATGPARHHAVGGADSRHVRASASRSPSDGGWH